MIKHKALSQAIIIVWIMTTFSCSPSLYLFNEENKDWQIYGDANWTFSYEGLIGDITDGTGFFMTNQIYNDFILELEFHPDSTINSGVFIRCQNKEINPTDCYELNIWDLHPNPDFMTGAFVLNQKPLAKVETIGKWNTFRINANGNRIQAWVNGVLTADKEIATHDGGYTALQASGTGQVKFRNVRLKPLN